MIEVTKEKFDIFIKNHPNELTFDVIRFAEPYIFQYNDFTEGKVWPESVVAQYTEEWDENYEPTGVVKYELPIPTQSLKPLISFVDIQ